MPVQTGPILGANGKEIRGIVRIAGRDLKGQWSVPRALRAVKGLGLNLGQVASRIVMHELKLTPKTMIGELDEAQMKKIEEILAHPHKFGAPVYLLNRQREFATNETHHLIAVDLGYAVKQDVEHEKDAYTWKGYRHAYGQKVRGQHTRSTGRSGMTVGVLRKAVIAKAGGAAGAAGQTAQAAAQAADKGKAAGATGAAPKAEKAAPAAKPAEKK
ncbi:30S ribosomal protein S13 [uncultured archaeon]|nr:30S ribosomal protein S13 [uncultured archaeon]